MTMAKPKCLKQVSLPVFLLVIMFSMSAWTDMNGVFVEMPFLVNALPERWALPSQMVLAVNLAYIGLLLFVITAKLFPGKVKERTFVMIIIGVGMVMCLCLVFLWNKTIYIRGKQRSVGFLAVVSVLSLVDCTSSVVYIPYMARFKTEYLTAYFIGHGFGSLIPGLVGLGQGVGSEPHCVNSTMVTINETTGDNVTEWKIQAIYDPPLFSVEIYFLFLFGVLLLSGISFLVLHLAPFCKKEYNQTSKTTGNSTQVEEDNEVELLEKMDKSNKQISVMPEVNLQGTLEINNLQFVLLLVLLATLSTTIYGILFSIFPYSAIPYGNVTLNLTIRLFSASLPVGAFLTFFHSATFLTSHVLMTILCVALVGYHVFLAFCSPYPPLQGTYIGSALVVVTGVLAGMISQYTYVAIGAVLKSSRGRMGLMWCGMSVQTGALLGSIISFLAINVFQAFLDIPPCK